MVQLLGGLVILGQADWSYLLTGDMSLVQIDEDFLLIEAAADR